MSHFQREQQIAQLIELRKYTAARKLIEGLLQDDPNNHWAMYAMAECFYHEDDYDRAISFCQSAIALVPDFAGAFFLQGSCHLLKGELGKGRQLIRAALEIEPENAMYLREYGRYYLAIDNLKAAKHYLELSAQSAPNHWVTLGLLAQVAIQEKNETEAERLLDIALELDPENQELLSTYGQLRQRQGQSKIALESLGAALQQDPGDAITRTALLDSQLSSNALYYWLFQRTRLFHGQLRAHIVYSNCLAFVVIWCYQAGAGLLELLPLLRLLLIGAVAWNTLYFVGRPLLLYVQSQRNWQLPWSAYANAHQLIWGLMGVAFVLLLLYCFVAKASLAIVAMFLLLLVLALDWLVEA